MTLIPLVATSLLPCPDRDGVRTWQGIAFRSSTHNYHYGRYGSEDEGKSVVEVLIELKADANAELKVPPTRPIDATNVLCVSFLQSEIPLPCPALVRVQQILDAYVSNNQNDFDKFKERNEPSNI